MARNVKKSNRIVVNETEYRWRARGNDYGISVTIWPANQIGPLIDCHFGYHETLKPNGPGVWCSQGDQIVITNRIVKRVIIHSINNENYNPDAKGPQLTIRDIEARIQWDDAIRAQRSES